MKHELVTSLKRYYYPPLSYRREVRMVCVHNCSGRPRKLWMAYLRPLAREHHANICC